LELPFPAIGGPPKLPEQIKTKKSSTRNLIIAEIAPQLNRNQPCVFFLDEGRQPLILL
jgi:hypothetical protein